MNSSVGSIIGAVILRSVAVTAIVEGVAWLYTRSVPDDDGLGSGLTAMAALCTIAALWGLVDGFRHDVVWICVTWVVTGVVVAVAVTVISNVTGPPIDWSILLQDLQESTFFWAALVFVPALGCGLLPALLAPHDRR